jgi:hypothetical protein
LSKDFPDWETLYKSKKVETMAWYNENLDSDLEEELDRREISKGKFLDLGTGPATQAILLAVLTCLKLQLKDILVQIPFCEP